MQGRPIRVASFNVNGILHEIKRGKILSKLRREKIQIAFLQETHLSDTEHSKLNKMGFKYIYSSSYKSVYHRGVAILLSNHIEYEYISEFKDKEGRFVLIVGKMNGILTTLFIPLRSDWAFYQKIFEIITTRC